MDGRRNSQTGHEELRTPSAIMRAIRFKSRKPGSGRYRRAARRRFDGDLVRYSVRIVNRRPAGRPSGAIVLDSIPASRLASA